MVSYEYWINNLLLEDTIAGQRVGQSYLNRVRPYLTYPELFHETCLDEAWKTIGEIEERFRKAYDCV